MAPTTYGACRYRTLAGDMSLSQRTKALQDFQNDPPTTVFLMSIKSGACGINLTQANHVFLVEPCINPALEKQAIGRVHRARYPLQPQLVQRPLRTPLPAEAQCRAQYIARAEPMNLLSPRLRASDNRPFYCALPCKLEGRRLP